MKRTLYHGGPILTMDPLHPRAEALLTENGKICAVGAYTELEGVEAERIDLKGKTLMPGFVDGHSHMVSLGLNLTKFCDLTGAACFEELLDRIRSFVKKQSIPAGAPITCKGYDLAIMREGVHPTAALLDSLGLDNPIACVHLSGHVAAYNTLAMEKAGVLTADYRCPAGGFAGRCEDGSLNGYFEETARGPFAAVFSTDITEKEIEKAVLAAQEVYLENGFTTVQDGSANPLSRLCVLQRLAKEGAFKVDVVAYAAARSSYSEGWNELFDSLGKGYQNRLKLGGMKLFLDGSPQVRTAWLRQPYENEAEYRGYPTLQDEEVKARLLSAVENGLQPIAHCNGDAASEQFLSLWERVTEETKKGRDLRPVMIHAQTVGYDQLERMARVGMLASFFVGHCFYWGDTHLKNLGERGMRISPVKGAMKKGVAFNFHQDSPVTMPRMLHSIGCAVNRVTRKGVVVGEENRIEPYEALMAATHGGAMAYFEEETKGILKPGALADLIVLDRDPTAVPKKEIESIRVLCTIKEDEVVYRRPEEQK
ncbi:MAG: amidohydrolase [Clostridia bacterium]|nr:amidohydrolase [Clostridia bacterium]